MIIKFLLRLFIKVTGILPFYLITKQMYFFSSSKAKREYLHPKKEGKILVSNHTSVIDYPVFMYLYFFRVVHTFASELMYRSFPMKIINWILDNIYINRKKTNLHALIKAENLLRKNKSLLIFPEGHIEKQKGKLEKFYESAVVLAFRTHSAITPHYITGDYSIKKRNRIIIGEKIYVNDLVKKDILEKEDIDFLISYLFKEISKLKNKLESIKKYSIKTIFTRKFFMLDIAKITSIFYYRLVWWTKIIWIGNKKEIKKLCKYNCLLAANHTGVCDVFFFYLYIFSRRVRTIASNIVYKKKFLAFCMNHSGVIKFNIYGNENFDYQGFKTAIDILDGTGIIGIFPEGHINTTNKMLPLHEGMATMSMITNTPIVPIYFVNVYRYWRKNTVIIGNPIYPDKNILINKDTIKQYNDKIIKAFDELVNEANKYRDYGKTRNSK